MKRILLILMTIIILVGCQNNSSYITKQDTQRNDSLQQDGKHNDTEEDNDVMKMILTINDQDFVIYLEQNNATQALVEQLPIEMTMEDLNGNEKYYYTQNSLPTDTQSIERIEAGDFMLFGNNCLVLFYDSFSTSYSYTRLGKVEDVEGYLDAINQNTNVNVTLHQ